MKGKDLLLIAGGLALGYLLFKKDLFKKDSQASSNGASGVGQITNGAGEIVSGVGSVVSGGVNTVTNAVNELVNPKQAECEKKWQDYASMSRFASQEAMDNAKKEFMKTCLV